MLIVSRLPNVSAQSRAFISGRSVKAVDWAETFGDNHISPSIYLASEVLNPQSCLHLATQRFSKRYNNHMLVKRVCQQHATYDKL